MMRRMMLMAAMVAAIATFVAVAVVQADDIDDSIAASKQRNSATRGTVYSMEYFPCWTTADKVEAESRCNDASADLGSAESKKASADSKRAEAASYRDMAGGASEPERSQYLAAAVIADSEAHDLELEAIDHVTLAEADHDHVDAMIENCE